MPAFVQRPHGRDIGPCAGPYPATRSVSSTADNIIIVLAIVAAILALASLVVAILQYRLHVQELQDLSEDDDAVPMTVLQQDRGSRPA